MYKYVWVSIIMMFSLCEGYSQKIKIIDDIDGQAIVDVLIISGNDTRVSDQYGMADISDFDKDSMLRFQHASYYSKSMSYKSLIEKDFVVRLTESVLKLDKVVVSANRWEQDKKEVPNYIESLRARDISFNNPQTAADMLSLSNQVFVQKSQMGGGSPMIRGFAANSVLLVVDGIRLNNAIYRSGNLQNVIMLDPNSMEGSEIIYGPGSVIYGSDALGGVMDFHTKKALLSSNGKPLVKANALFRYASANQEKTTHLDINYGRTNWSFLTSFSFSDFGDLRMGSRGHDEYLRPEYVRFIDGKDSVVENERPEKQIQSAYSQVNFLQKIRFRPSDKLDINYVFQYSKSSDIPRYDRLIQYSGSRLKYGDWFYGPQEWMQNSLRIDYTPKNALFDKLKLCIAEQEYEESRHDRKFGKDWLRSRTESLSILNLNVDLEKEILDKLELFYGFESYYNYVQSNGIEKNIYSGEIEEVATRYPDGGTNYYSFAAYSSLKYDLSKFLNLTGGVRYTRSLLFSVIENNSFYNFPFHEINMNNGALNGSLGLAWHPASKWQMSLNFSSGFRAPNLDDVGKVFDSEPGNVVVPNPDLKPEYAYNVDFTLSRELGEKARIEANVFHTWLKDAMVRRDYQFNGMDSIMYDGEMSKVEALVNTGSAYIYGGSIAFITDIGSRFSFKTSLNYQNGEDMEGVPLRHVTPMFGQTHLVYKYNRLKMDFYFLYNGEKSFDEMSPSEISKPYMYASDEEGNPYSPAWTTSNFKLLYQLNSWSQINLGVENIFDVRYRPYSSGIVAPGRNFMIALRLRI